jgi:hypothetical protein
MAIHLVGTQPPASVRLSGIIRFRTTRWVRGETTGDFADARVDCQNGEAPRPGHACLDCPRMLGWREGLEPGQLSVCCAWGHFDPVSARMTSARALITVSPNTRCAAAHRIALDEGVHRLLVLEGSQLLGVVSRRDVANGGDCPVSQVMGGDVFVIDAAAQLGEAAAAFDALNIGCLPVVREGRLVGVLTRGDLRRAGLRLQ